MPRPVFVRTGVPGIGSVEVYRNGRIVLGDDIELTRNELADLVHAVITAGFAARDHDSRPIRRPVDVDARMAALADYDQGPPA